MLKKLYSKVKLLYVYVSLLIELTLPDIQQLKEVTICIKA